MTNIAIAWIGTTFLVGFIVYLLPQLSRWLSLGISCFSAVIAVQLFLRDSPLELKLLDSFGVTLLLDNLSGWFILTNALVTTAVICYCWRTSKEAFFFMQLIILHGSVNATFICADFISLYVALEVISVAAFLLIVYSRTDKTIWVGLRYLFVSNVAMLFYLMGVALVYQANRSFAFDGLQNAPIEAITLIFLGLLIKGGIFVSGMWLPLTHSESETPVSAMLSGVVVKAGVFPLIRCALMLEVIDPVVRLCGVATALLGVSYAVFAKDTKRMLAFHTISQLGFILAAPAVGGFYALTHGLVKSALFLIAGTLPSRNFKELQYQPIGNLLWLALVIASFSISGFPLLSGFGAKVLTTKALLPWQTIAMNIAALGTAISFAKFIFLPHQKFSWHSNSSSNDATPQKIQPGFWLAMIILLGGLFVANIYYLEAYTLKNIAKSLITIALGWTAYKFIFKQSKVKLPRYIEQFEHLIGVMSLTAILLFWVLWVQLSISI